MKVSYGYVKVLGINVNLVVISPNKTNLNFIHLIYL